MPGSFIGNEILALGLLVLRTNAAGADAHMARLAIDLQGHILQVGLEGAAGHGGAAKPPAARLVADASSEGCPLAADLTLKGHDVFSLISRAPADSPLAVSARGNRASAPAERTGQR